MPDEPNGDVTPAFRTVLRGYDRDEVDRRLAELTTSLEQVRQERDQLAARLQETGYRDLESEFESIGREVGQVLESARRAADTMRQHASADAARWRSEAVAEAEAERRRAAAEAEQLRGDAWSTADELLSQAQREARRMLELAEQDGLRRVGEAEREAHRISAAARREADEAVRNAKMESERLLIEATSRRDEIMESARREAESTWERTRALEARRDELKRELDSVREALALMEGELDERRERLGLSAPTDAEAEVVGPAGHRWEPGETVRVVRPKGGPESVPVEPVTELEADEVSPQDMKPDVRVISADELSRRSRPDEQPVLEPPGPEQSEEAEGEEEPPGVEAQGPGPVPATEEAATGEPPPSRPVGEPRPTAGADEEGRFEELAGLFSRLRTPGEETSGEELRPEPAEAPTPAAAISRPTAEVMSIDPFELRDRLLLPVTNRALRSLKRQLTEQQNVALEELRLDETGWHPDPTDLAEGIRADLVVLVAESYGAGHAAAEEIDGDRLPRPPSPQTDEAEPLAADLGRELAHVLDEGRAAGQGGRQLGAAVSRVFRAWRTDEAERRVRDLALSSYNRGLVDSISAGRESPPQLRWLVAGRGCATCRAAAEDSGGRLPPLHHGCGCAIVPA